MRVLITGVTGFAGSHLAEFLLEQPGVEVYGACRWRSRMDNLDDLNRRGKVTSLLEQKYTSQAELAKLSRPNTVNLVRLELSDPMSAYHTINSVRPDRIFHLAAQSYVMSSWTEPSSYFLVNSIGQVHLFEAVRQVGIDPVIQIAGSSEEYGDVHPDEAPIKESNPLRPLSPYAVSKVTQDYLARQYFHSYGMRTIVTRGFNHTGPRRGEVFFDSSFAKQIAEIEKGRREPVLHVGDLTPKRDLTDVRDMIRAYWLLTERGAPGEVYNTGSGVTHTIEHVMNLLLGMSDCKIEVREDPSRLRPSDVVLLLADASKMQKATGWEPRYTLEQTERDLLDYWRAKV